MLIHPGSGCHKVNSQCSRMWWPKRRSSSGLGDSSVALKTLTHGLEISEKDWAEGLRKAASHKLSLSLKIEIIE